MMITDRVVSLGVLAAGMSHHMRNSLVAVRTFLDLAPAKLREEQVNLEELRNPNYWREFYDHVQSQINRIMQMLADLGAVSEKPNPTFTDRVELHNVVAKALEKNAASLAGKKIQIENQVSNTLPALTVDAPKFQRVFDLLLKDEAVNLPEGSRITLRALPPTNGTVQFELRDNGPGLPQNDLRSVFNPFFVRKENPQEFGINLMTCFFLVFHHGGKIDVESDKDGTVFILTLPIQPPEPAVQQGDRDFVAKVLANEQLWEKLLSGD
jgi:two-component system probable response regulator PhcQ